MAKMASEDVTARELVRAAEARLAEAGVEGAGFDAELLLAETLGSTRPELIAGLSERVAPRDAARYEAAVARRAAREPLAYITGRKGFRGIELHVDRRVLIPRPETELLVSVVAAHRPAKILEVATGSGAVALALADELPDARVLATDVSDAALAVARVNAERLGLDERVEFARSDLLEEVHSVFDAIAANLPYVRSSEIDTLQPEIAFEPRAALDGGEDGLDLVRRLAAQVRKRSTLAPGGLLALEIGDDQGPAAIAILTQAGFDDAKSHRDLAGRDRVVTALAPKAAEGVA